MGLKVLGGGFTLLTIAPIFNLGMTFVVAGAIIMVLGYILYLLDN